MTESRPDPDELLARVEREEAAAVRGRLRIYFGASAGVGKTYGMLTAAHEQLAGGRDIVIGLVETHGRADTQALLDGLDVLPRHRAEVQGRIVEEFDLDAALARRPQILVVDELAHTNAPGSRHPKRWQDVDELLSAGIDVYTAMNVQHLESLNDVVGGITSVRVRETVPDRFFDSADEVILVDLPPDELIARLRQGKVYLGDQAERAAQHFFRKGNLIALRELALRRTADRVDVDMRAWRRAQSVEIVWRAGGSLLACVGPAPGAEHVVRSAGRLALQLGVPWQAVYVETPTLQRLPESERHRILAVLRLAEDLGATTATLPGDRPAVAAAEYARARNFGRVVVGRRPSPRRHVLGRRFADAMTTLAPELEVIEVPMAEATGAPPPVDPASEGTASGIDWRRYGYGAAAIALTTTLLIPLAGVLELSNIVMLFLLAVVGIAHWLGRGPAALAALLAVAGFDFFFVPPRFSLAVSDVQYLVTFLVMLGVGLLVGQLTSGLRYQARVAISREMRAESVFGLARELSGAIGTEQIDEIVERFAREAFRGRARLLLPDPAGRVHARPGIGDALDVDPDIAQWTNDRGEPAGLGTGTLPGTPILYLPLRAPMRTRGTIAIEVRNPRWGSIPEQRRLFETFASLVAIALERIHYVEVARDALVDIESERIRNALLASISHDLRTPLSGILGAATSLAELEHTLSPAQRRELTRSIEAEARRMSDLIGNVLQMARLEAGQVKATPQWIGLDELVGAALRAAARPLKDHPLTVHLPAELTLAHVDPLLMDQLLVNLLTNAARHTPPGTPVEIRGARHGDRLELAIADRGPGLGNLDPERLFEKFRQAHPETSPGGVGLGLSICRTIATLHGGTITAANREGGGAVFRVSLPQPAVPTLAPEAPE